jgi:hypothetical protein
MPAMHATKMAAAAAGMTLITFTDHDQNIPSATAMMVFRSVTYHPVTLCTSTNERATYSGSQTSNPPPTLTNVPPTPTTPTTRGYARRSGSVQSSGVTYAAVMPPSTMSEAPVM